MTRNELAALAEFLAETPAKVRRLTAGLDERETRLKPAADEFSVVENICHLRDIEVDGYAGRIGRILLEEEPFLPDLNGAQLAAERRYNEQALDAALDDFTGARRGNLLVIKGLSDAQLERSGTFENTGAITLGRLLEMMREHDSAHLAELSALRGKLARTKLQN